MPNRFREFFVTFRCGHQGHLRAYLKGAAWAARHASETLCPGCFERDLAERRAEQSRRAADANGRAGLPELQGSPKQIAWAETIRAEALVNPRNDPARILSRKLRPSLRDAARACGLDEAEIDRRIAAIRDAAVAARRELEIEASAHRWIDERARWNIAEGDWSESPIEAAVEEALGLEFAELRAAAARAVS